MKFYYENKDYKNIPDGPKYFCKESSLDVEYGFNNPTYNLEPYGDIIWLFEIGGFYEMHKYAQRYDLPIRFVVEDNGVSTNTPTEETWNGIKREVPNDVIWYNYKKEWPHYGTGKWVIF